MIVAALWTLAHGLAVFVTTVLWTVTAMGLVVIVGLAAGLAAIKFGTMIGADRWR